ncbi:MULTISPECIES: MFS transporter [Stappiaceae]|jgi:MFS family permease|uniref:Putative MFS-type transporter YhjX n=2 Tax=Roseibium TaxID=150830 RepID=A0A0M6XZK2_9HYPH|nr:MULTISPECIES: MFS transporter [Stappiaceae]MEC9420626.1 MFS transporter [Pseudomonadota bacterium]ERP94174.1 MFS transporter [Labrenzia sp. C1B10]ERS04999.1 MFS transporter [Labrenzia sp. C1B70]MBN8182421.1 MFS transporter [Roseibium aggregatum]QFS99320.1 putative MFS-type transporter YhjX [Labrenzia sp. THAF191b]
MSLANASDPYVQDGPYAWFRLAISILLSTLGGAGMWAVVIVLPAVQTDFGIDRAGASLPYTATMFGFAAGNYLLGRVVDRYGIVIPVIGSALSLGAGFVLAAFAPDVWSFSLAQGLLIGLGTAATFGPLIADISHWFLKRRGFAVACAACGNYLAGVLWPSLIQWSLATSDWRQTYILIGVICLVAMVPLALLLRRPPPDTSLSTGAATARFGRQDTGLPPAVLQALLVVAGLACCVAMSMPQVHIVAYCVDLGYGVAPGADMIALMTGAGVISRLASGYIADKIGGVMTLLIGSVLQCAALFLFIPFNGLASLYLVSLIFGLSQGGIVPSYAVIVREYLPAREAGQRVGLVIMATILGMALGGWLSGWIYDLTGSYQAAFLNGIAWNFLNMAVMIFIFMRGKMRPTGAAA